MNPNQPRQQRQQMSHSGQTQESEFQIRDDQTIIKTDVETVLSPEQTVRRYNRLVQQITQLNESVTAYSERIESELDEHNLKQGALHTIFDDHPQSDEEDLPPSEDFVDFFSNEDLERYLNIQEMHSQIEKAQEQIQNGLEDADGLHNAARTMADRHGFELEMAPQEVRNEIGEPVEEE